MMKLCSDTVVIMVRNYMYICIHVHVQPRYGFKLKRITQDTCGCDCGGGCCCWRW